MIVTKQIAPFFCGVIWAIITGVGLQTPTLANDSSMLCDNRNMVTEVAVSTPEFYAAFCSTGYYEEEPGCYAPTAYYYMGQSRTTRESIVLENATWSVENGLRIYKATNGNYTYQIATKGAYTAPSWRSLSVFENGRRIYHQQVDGYFGYWDC